MEYALANMGIDGDNEDATKRPNTIGGLSIDYIQRMKIPDPPRSISALTMLTRIMPELPFKLPDNVPKSHANELNINPVSTVSENAPMAPANEPRIHPSHIFTQSALTSAQTQSALNPAQTNVVAVGISRASTQMDMNVNRTRGPGFPGYTSSAPAVGLNSIGGSSLPNHPTQVQPMVQSQYQPQNVNMPTINLNVQTPSSANSAYSNRDVTPSQMPFQNEAYPRYRRFPVPGQVHLTSDAISDIIQTRIQPNSYSNAVMQSGQGFQLPPGTGLVGTDNYNNNYSPMSNMNIRANSMNVPNDEIYSPMNISVVSRDVPNLTQMPNPLDNANVNIHEIQNIARDTSNLNLLYGSNLPNLPGPVNVPSTPTLHPDNTNNRPVSILVIKKIFLFLKQMVLFIYGYLNRITGPRVTSYRQTLTVGFCA